MELQLEAKAPSMVHLPLDYFFLAVVFFAVELFFAAGFAAAFFLTATGIHLHSLV
jgi:hypothetical protein